MQEMNDNKELLKLNNKANQENTFQQFKTLVKKEFFTHKKTILMPVYIQGGLYAGIILICIFALFRGELAVETTNFDLILGDLLPTNSLFWFLGFANVLFLWLLFLICYNSLDNCMVNDDYKHKCTLFHNSLPVSMMNKVLAKLFTLLTSTILVYSGLVLMNILIQMVIIKLVFENVSNQEIFSYTFLGMIQGLIIYITSLIAIFSLGWFFSALYKERTGTKAILTIGILIAFSIITARLFGLFQQLKDFGNWIMRIFWPMFPNNILDNEIQILILEMWLKIFNGEMIVRIAITVLLFAVGTFIINKREII